MSRVTGLHLVLALCLCCAGVLEPVRVWADPVALQSSEALGIADTVTTVTDVTPADAATSADANLSAGDLGTGLKLSMNLSEREREGPLARAAASARPSSVFVLADKSLASVRRDTANKPRLGRELGEGVASWYGPRFHGRRTASGERFDRYALTAAHKTLPLGTRVVVSNPRTGKRVVVRINDRGPYLGNRVLDLSEAAASALGLKTRGVDWVVMNAVLPPSDGRVAVDYAAADGPAHDAAVPAPAAAVTENELAAAGPPSAGAADMPVQAAAQPSPAAAAPAQAAAEAAPADSLHGAVAKAATVSAPVQPGAEGAKPALAVSAVPPAEAVPEISPTAYAHESEALRPFDAEESTKPTVSASFLRVVDGFPGASGTGHATPSP